MEMYLIELHGIGEVNFILMSDKSLFDWVTEDTKMPEYVKDAEDWEEYEYSTDWNDKAMFLGMVADKHPDKIPYFHDTSDYVKYVRENNVEVIDSTEGHIY